MRNLKMALLSMLFVVGGQARAAGKPEGKLAVVPGSPLAQIKDSNERIEKILKSKKREDAAAKEELKATVNGFLDFDELAKRSLAQHWDTLQPGQRGEFVKTLKELIEKNYVRQLKTNLEYEVVYKNEAVSGDDATVSTAVKVKTKGKTSDTAIDYKMRKVEARWRVYDVITDEVSMVKNYRQQFNKIITQDGFDALLKKMRSRIAAADEDAKAEKAESGGGGEKKK